MSDLPPQPSEAALAAANLPDGQHPITPHVEVPAGAIPIDPALNEPAATETAADNDTKDVHMTDVAGPTSLPSAANTVPPSAAAQAQSNAPSPLPGRVSTPVRNVAANGESERSGSRAASAHPDPTFTMPAEAPPHGAPVRQYINSKITGVLLEGMKLVAREQPKDPLRVLGEYLIMRSKEIETSTA